MPSEQLFYNHPICTMYISLVKIYIGVMSVIPGQTSAPVGQKTFCCRFVSSVVFESLCHCQSNPLTHFVRLSHSLSSSLRHGIELLRRAPSCRPAPFLPHRVADSSLAGRRVSLRQSSGSRAFLLRVGPSLWRSHQSRLFWHRANHRQNAELDSRLVAEALAIG